MRLQPKLPHTMGVDFAGIVEAVGTDVHDWQRGDAVYGFVPLETGGAQATFVVAQPGNLRRKPPGLSFTAAAAIPVAALTAWKSLFELGALRADQRLLVQGASGAVGSAAVQLASRAGAHVAGTASASNLEYLRSLGVDPAIDYRAQRFEETAHDYDMVLDAVGGETTERSLATLRRGGTIVTLSSFADPGRCANLGLRCVFNPSFVPAGAGFDAIDALVQRGQLTVPVGQAYPLREAAAALAAVRAGSGHGRIVLTMEERP
jgi:NADPH:quinone reductase-like Zn-dependent oxidoreductase